jgi:hypothetical protein
MNPITNRIRSFNKHFLNHLLGRIARADHSGPFAIVRHVGRRSGKPYETPIIVRPIDGGFVIALTYGPDVDWYKSVLAAGRCAIRWHGKDYTIEHIEPLDTETGLGYFGLPFSPILRLNGVKNFVRMRY